MKTRLIIASGILLLTLFGLTATNAQEAPTPQLVCGLEIYPSPSSQPEPEASPVPQASLAAASNLTSGDPCLDGTTVFGPVRFEKTTFFPRVESATFDIEADGDVCILSESSGYGSPVKSWPYLKLDGTLISKPKDYKDLFDQQIQNLAAGTHDVETLIFGRRGAWLDVEARQIVPDDDDGGDDGGGDFPGLPMPGEVQIDPDNGALDMVNADGSVRLQNLATDHPLLTPNGDGDDDTTIFSALTTPLVPLPGKDDSTVDYFLDWAFQVVNLDTCATIDTGLSGTEQINSPTLVTAPFDGTDATGSLLPDGNYAYSFDVNVVDENGAGFGSVTSPGFGLLIDGDSGTADFDERPEQLGPCNPSTDPSGCVCPGVDGAPGVEDPTCRSVFVTELLPELGLPPGTMPNYVNPENVASVDKSFITTSMDASTGRYTVTVDLRVDEDCLSEGACGLVPKGRPIWDNEADLRQWVFNMTGVPDGTGTGDSLFNFDFVQLGTTSSVDQNGTTGVTFNHFFIDAMTDSGGTLRIAGQPAINVQNLFNDDVGAPSQYAVPSSRTGDECSSSGNTDGVNGMRGKLCAYNTAFRVSDNSDLGIYALRTTVFGIEYNNISSKEDDYCIINGIFTCGVRTYRVTADTIEIEQEFYVETATEPGLTRTENTQTTDAIGLSFTADRGDGEDGVCSNAVATRDGLAVRMDAADGAVPDSCIINGIF